MNFVNLGNILFEALRNERSSFKMRNDRGQILSRRETPYVNFLGILHHENNSWGPILLKLGSKLDEVHSNEPV